MLFSNIIFSNHYSFILTHFFREASFVMVIYYFACNNWKIQGNFKKKRIKKISFLLLIYFVIEMALDLWVAFTISIDNVTKSDIFFTFKCISLTFSIVFIITCIKLSKNINKKVKSLFKFLKYYNKLN